MLKEIIHLQETTSTNDYLRLCPTPAADAMTVATAEHQTAGRGQGCNRWESEPGKNLLFSILTNPTTVPADRQFVLSMAGALALKDTLDRHCMGITLKWPNDIYWHDCKISGTLIETALAGKTIRRCIYGIGLNVNQRTFLSDAPNPISLYNITGIETQVGTLLNEVLGSFEKFYGLAVEGHHLYIAKLYNEALYRRDGLHVYEDCLTGERFEATISHVETDGHLHLIDNEGKERTYTLKEVRFVME